MNKKIKFCRIEVSKIGQQKDAKLLFISKWVFGLGLELGNLSVGVRRERELDP